MAVHGGGLPKAPWRQPRPARQRLGVRWVGGEGTHRFCLGRAAPSQSGASPVPRRPPHSKTLRQCGRFMEMGWHTGSRVGTKRDAHPRRTCRTLPNLTMNPWFHSAARIAAENRAGVKYFFCYFFGCCRVAGAILPVPALLDCR